MARRCAGLKVAAESLKPHIAPSLRALSVLAKATDILTGRAYAGNLTAQEAHKLLDAIDRLIPQLKYEHLIVKASD